MIPTIQSSQLRLFTISACFPINISHIQDQEALRLGKGELRLSSSGLLAEDGAPENKNREQSRRPHIVFSNVQRQRFTAAWWYLQGNKTSTAYRLALHLISMSYERWSRSRRTTDYQAMSQVCAFASPFFGVGERYWDFSKVEPDLVSVAVDFSL
jgi:hypothetical protein